MAYSVISWKRLSRSCGEALPLEALEQLADVGRDGHALAGQQLLEGDAVVQADAAAGDQFGGVLRRHVIGVGDQRVAARAVAAEAHLVVAEVGLLGDDRDAVRERPSHGVDRLDRRLLDDAARRRERRQQRHVVEGVLVGRHHERVRLVESRLQGRGQIVAAAGVDPLGPQHEQHRVPRLRPGVRQRIDLRQRDLGQQLLVQLPLRFDAGDRGPDEEVVGVPIRQLARPPLIPLRVFAFHRAQQVDLLPRQLAVGEAVLADALQLLQQGGEAALDAGLLDHDRKGLDVQRLDHPRASGAGPQPGRVGGLTALEQPRVQHHEGQLLDRRAAEGRHVPAGLGGDLANQDELGAGRLGVGEDVDARRVVVGDREARPVGGVRDGGALGGGLALGRRREVLADLGLDQRRIEVAHGDHGHQVGPVPALVVGPQLLHGRGFEDLGQADRAAVGVAGGAEEQREQVGLEARREPLIQAPLLEHDAALELHLVGVEADRVRPVAENLEGRLEDLGVVGRDLQEVQRVVVAGLGVEIGAKAAADRLEVVDDLLLGEARRPVEGHVLDEVGQPALLVLLKDGTRLHDQGQLPPAGRFLVLPDVVDEAVAEGAADHCGVEG